MGPDLWGLLSVSMQLKRSRRRPEECASPVGAIPGLTADTSQMDPVASVQDGMFGERYLILTDHKKDSLSTCEGIEGRGKKGFSCIFFLFPLDIFSYSSLSYTRLFPELHCRNSQ